MLLGRPDYKFDNEYTSSEFPLSPTDCLYRNIDCVLALNICGADLNAMTKSDHWNPLHIACRIAYLPLICISLRPGVKTNTRKLLENPHGVASSHGSEKICYWWMRENILHRTGVHVSNSFLRGKKSRRQIVSKGPLNIFPVYFLSFLSNFLVFSEVFPL